MISWRGMARCWLLAVLVCWAGCGPTAYIRQVTFRADSAVEDARRADAEKLAPYWWTRAVEYLRKARETAARADFQGANRFGRLATEAAEKAVEEAKDPSKRPLVLPKDNVAPAKDSAAPAKDAVAPAKDAP